jgi:hypothetical protein
MNEKSDENPLKLCKIINPRSETIPVLVFIKKQWDLEEEEIWEKELRLLDLKYKAMKIKISERIPIYSKREGHQWFLTKDNLGLIYFMLVNESFLEKYLFKMHKKINNFIETNMDKMDDPTQKEYFHERILEIVEEFSLAIVRNLEISSEKSDINIIEQEGGFQLEYGQENEQDISEESDFFKKIEKRNQRVLILQVIFLIGLLLGIILAILHFVLFLKEKK